MRISLIVAVSQNGVIGRNGDLPWRLSADLKRFKQRTMGHHLIMGRRTFESIGRVLPGRTSVVLTRQGDYRAPGALVAHSPDEALQLARDDDEIFVIGGAEVFQQMLPRADRIYRTRIQARIEGDVRFPTFDASPWRVVEQSEQPADERNEYACRFEVLERVTPPRCADGN